MPRASSQSRPPIPAASSPTPASLKIAARHPAAPASEAGNTPPCEPVTTTAPAASGPSLVMLSAVSGSGDTITLLHRDRTAVSGGQHLRRVAGDDDIEDHRPAGLGQRRAQRARQRIGRLDPQTAAAERLGDGSVVGLGQIARLIGAWPVH